MKKKIYAIRDTKADAFWTPIFSQNHATALRSFESSVREEGSALAKHAEDYQMYYLGEFDESTGIVEGVPPEHLANAIDFEFKQE